MFNKFLHKLHYLFFFIFLIIVSYTIYKSEIFYNGTNRFYYIQFYIISLIFLILGFVYFFLNENSKKNFFLSFISIIISFYILESFLLFTEPLNPELKKKVLLYKKQTGKNYDTRSNADAFIQERERNPDLKKKIGPQHYLNKFNIDIYPLSGVSNSLNLYCNENGYFSYYTSDKHGFRNPNFEWDKDIIDYLLVGDSFTLGACVNSPNDISSRLRNLSQEKSILNLGFGGNGPLISYAALREYLPKKKVKNVLFLFYEEGELDDLKDELKHPILRKYFENINFTQNLYEKQNEIDEINILSIEKALENYINTQEEKKFLLLSQTIKFFRLRSLILSKIVKEETITPKKIPEFKKILKNYKKLTIENNSKFYFVYLPTFHRYNNNFNNTIYDETLKLLDELQIQIIDVKKEFDKHQDPKSLFPFRMYAHYNIEGYRFVSKIIYENLKK